MKEKPQYVWVITSESESGDNSGPEVYDHKPTPEEKKKFITGTGEELNQGGPGAYGSYVYLDITKCPVKKDLNKPELVQS